MVRIAVVIGTRPEIIRMAPVIDELKIRKIPFYLVHTGQHYDFNMSEIFIRDLGLPKPDFHFKYHEKTHAKQTATIMMFLEKVFTKVKTDLVLVEGDTNSVMATALTARKLQIPVGQTEAGCRAFDMSKPEEVNRVITDHISTLLFAPSEICKNFLLQEGIDEKNIFVTGNTVIDACLKYVDVGEKKSTIYRTIKNKIPYVLVTLHRSETVDNKEKLMEFLKLLQYVSLKYRIIFPVHPRTQQRLRFFNLLKEYKKIENLELMEPLGYLDFLPILKNSKLALTDSGGVLMENTAFKIPTIIFDDNWADREGYNVFWFLSGHNHENAIRIFDKIIDSTYKKELENKPSPFGDGKAGKHIVDICVKLLSGKLKFSDKTLKPS